MFTKVLVANRGEIAVRVCRTLCSLGIASVAVYSDADRDALHVEVADEAFRLGPAEARLSYLDIDRVIAAALQSGAQAIHPGYGFLSENADFAEACERSGIVFIGPDSRSIRLMGDKRGAKDSVAGLGVPVVPGFHGTAASDAELIAECALIGYPVIVKPSAGGGGKGIRVVYSADEVIGALASSRREASAAFGDDAVLLEKYLPRARHVEVQVLGDGHGRVVQLGTRDCSIQRRHQKVIEEAPAPFLPDDVRGRMHADAVTIAQSVNYRGVGTVEFVVDADEPVNYYFLEMNTRLQVEHPVTEVVTGLDLVELQIRVAAGEPMPISQDDVAIRGHAVEARVYAEDGHHDFLPSSGTLVTFAIPADARIDSGVKAGGKVGTSYDPLLFKVITSGNDRERAFDALDSALARTTVLGLAHNVGALRNLVSNEHVRAGTMTTSLIAELGLGSSRIPPDAHRMIAVALWLGALREERGVSSVWTQVPGWRVGVRAPILTRLIDEDGASSLVAVHGPVSACMVSLDGGDLVDVSLTLTRHGAETRATVTVGGVARRYVVAAHDTPRERVVWIGFGGDTWSYRVPDVLSLRRPDDDGDDDGELRSPMPGTVVLLSKAAGSVVQQGDVIAIVEAMKMEHALVSPMDGIVASVSVVAGAQVRRDQLIAVVTSAP